MKIASAILLASSLTIAACSGGDAEQADDPMLTDDSAVATAPAGGAGGEIPIRFRGTYDSDGGDCDTTDELYLNVRDDGVQFFEGSGTVSSVTEQGDTADLGLSMTSEGESFDRAYQLTLSNNGDTLSMSGEGMSEPASRQRCFPA